MDASAIVDLVIDAPAGRAVARQLRDGGEAWAPELLQVEVASALWRLNRAGALADDEATQAMSDALAVPLELVSHLLLGQRAWGLRQGLRISGAYYVALAEHLGAPLLTTDQRLARAARGISVTAVT
ncbi:type II toxin-antitoxin system VapC family toxin [Ornithinimicrobium cryptoxanthini]|uniref:Ribonuclease VapC n=1 Tax=Ornithinimicrobium cryptoxanthini TaxID=2934161 RepID=A0ABY4YJS8_9MICO|nr:type II toxin-antitoxin system VapC family toxin [Ornithinimicrobium cryptoxanthini]USQ77050.1 type II toxin-antitoxin system VapC family toxin [Ornithinimicrobium cryptoxanthini]